MIDTNAEAEAEIARLAQYFEHSLLDPPIFFRAAMRWAFEYSAGHCEAQIPVWRGTNVDPAHVLDMTAKNLRALAAVIMKEPR